MRAHAHRTGKSAAKLNCALAAVRQLHELRALDDHLGPAALVLPQDGKPANAALADKIMHRGAPACVGVERCSPP